jgi:hypothetical protein
MSISPASVNGTSSTGETPRTSREASSVVVGDPAEPCARPEALVVATLICTTHTLPIFGIEKMSSAYQ